MSKSGMRKYWALAILTLVGCGNDSEPVSEFDAALRRWQEKAPLHYSYSYQMSCFCVDDATRKVKLEVDRFGTVIAGTYLDTGEAIDTEKLAAYPSIAELFGKIAAAQAANFVMVAVEYDPEYGFPSSIYLDQDEMMADEEVGYSVGDLTPLPTPYER